MLLYNYILNCEQINKNKSTNKYEYTIKFSNDNFINYANINKFLMNWLIIMGNGKKHGLL